MKHTLITSLAMSSVLVAGARSAQPISQEDFISAAENTVNGVVSVKSYSTPKATYSQRGFSPFEDPFFQYFFGGVPQEQPRRQTPAEPQQTGLGSGVIISTDGLIVTNNHVIDGADKLEVTLNDNRNYTAAVVGADPVTDLALIKIDAPDLHVIPMGDSDSLHVGEWVLAVGNPFGFTSTVTSGIVSAKARNISSTTGGAPNGSIEAYIQTDAAVNRGNSGGALVNLNGELVGINAAIYSQTGTYAGCSFAIPTSIVQKVVADLKEFGTVQRAFLGITFAEVTPELISEKDLKGVTRGIYVATVQDRSAAKEAGLKPGDVIMQINGVLVTSTATLQEVMARLSPGDKIEMSVVRDGKYIMKEATVRNRDGKLDLARPETMMGVLGATFEKPTEKELEDLEISRGVKVAITGEGRFSDAGVRDGFIIMGINNHRISSPEEVEKIFNSVRALGPGEEKVLFISGIYPGGKQAYYAIDLSE